MSDISLLIDEKKFNYRVAAVWVEKGHVLIHRMEDDAFWALPGGRVKIGEESSAALEREMKEELDVTIEITGLPWIAENFFAFKGTRYHEIGFYYSVTGNPPGLTLDSFHGPEGDRFTYKWVPLEALAEYPMKPRFIVEGIQSIPESTVRVIIQEDEDENN